MPLSPEKDIIAVHQMGKVGSTSVFAGLKKALPGFRVLHTHHYVPDTILRMIRKTITPEGVIPPHLRDSVELRHWVRLARREDRNEEPDGARVHLISLVRDPIARNMSAFFENIERWIAKLPKADQAVIESILLGNSTGNDDARAIQSLQRIFAEGYKHGIAESWMEEELCEPMGVEMNIPFDQTRGFTIYEGEPIRLLVFQLERLDESLRPALQQFLGIDNFPLASANKGENKRYSGLYKQFVSSIDLPETYLNKMYSGPQMRYFYSEETLQAFRQKWSGSKG